MAINKAFPLAAAGAVVGAGAAWLSGVLAPYGAPSPLVDPAAIVDVAPEPAREELSALTQSADQPNAAAAPGADAAPAAPALPSFDIVRVQPDGSMVLAGRAPAGATVEIVAGERLIGSTVTDESGAFAFVLDTPLPAGNYDIALVAKTAAGEVRSQETAVVQIPDSPAGDVLAIVTAPGEASEVVAAGAAPATPATIVSPATQDEQAAVAATSAPPPVAADAATGTQDGAAVAGNEGGAAVAGNEGGAAVAGNEGGAAVAGNEGGAAVAGNEGGAAVAAQPAGEAAAPAGDAVAVAPAAARIAAVEMEGEQLTVSGSAGAGATVRVYMGDALVGDAIADADGNFALMTRFPVAAGSQTVRADVVDPATGAVLSRAAVPFERPQGADVAVAAAPGAGQQPLQEQAAGTVITPAASQASIVIRKGDTLWQISRRVYGKGVLFSTIYNANLEQIADPDRIWPGQVFVMPRQTEDGTAADFDGAGGRVTQTPATE